jgi:putative ABC transport system substrate-binding protein
MSREARGGDGKTRAKPVSRKIFIWLLATVLLPTARPTEAQQLTGKGPRIGVLAALSFADIGDRIQAFQRGLRDLGYINGENIIVEYRYADRKFDRLPDLADDLVRLKVNVIVTGGPTATRPAKQKTSTIPVVMAQDTDPVGNGFVASLSRPGGNITGL